MLRKGMFLADRYEIIEQIGTGGMSDVYKAKCHKLNRFVAIKVLKQEFSEDKTFVSKFRVEAQSAAGLAHPNIVNVYDVGDENGVNYIVMELVEGITLKKYIEKRGKIPYKEAASIAIQVANGMEAAHKHHIVHRDIKPQNIIISKEGKVKVTDFGIAKSASTSTINSSSAMGSVHYISPEQARGGYSDERSDIYSFGITLFEMLTGTVPFDGDSTVAVAVKHIQDEIPAPSTATDGIPISIDKIVLKCTQKKTERRYQNVSELIVDLKKSLVMPDEDFVKMVPVFGAVADAELPLDDENEDIDDDGILMDDEVDETDEDDVLASDDEDEDDDTDIDDESNNSLDKLMKWIGVGIVAVFLIIAIFIVVRLVGGSSTASTKETTIQTTAQATTSADSANKVEVPDLSGKTEAEAKEALNAVNLGFKATYQTSDTIESGKVINQGTKAGTSVAKNTTITVSISSGTGNVSVTNVVGKSESDATSTLKSAGFTVNVEYSYSDSVAQGNVISQTPSANSSVASGASVTITVSQGKQTKTATVPNVIGKSNDAARQALEAEGLVCKVGTAISTTDKSIDGTVASQGYLAGTTLDQGTSVTIQLYEYKQPEPQTTTAASGSEIGSGAQVNN